MKNRIYLQREGLMNSCVANCFIKQSMRFIQLHNIHHHLSLLMKG